MSSAAAALEAIARAIEGRRIAVLTGAGVSTGSGIPDYRGPDGRWRRESRPVQYRDFVSSEAVRRRYWARSSVGWPWFRERAPNPVHQLIVDLEGMAASSCVITQNVDGLHQAAGSATVIELHGNLNKAVCLRCGVSEHRDRLQERIMRDNPGWSAYTAEMAPDGDAELVDEAVEGFRVPACERCAGVLKPAVVFFGESVPGERVHEAYALLDRADMLLVLGSSLSVYSGYRFVRHAGESKKPVYCINRGSTRADSELTIKIDEPLEPALTELMQILVRKQAVFHR
ncbi:MAG: NAD-dependent protein deacetylase [Spirochaetaceae bacterium]